ncbi:1,2-phenylacetyl-CoA epoxidase subunit PaaD [Corynebacterium glyciniphilum]|uniref:1,2-phenylacetyl-CoA epoxidase subunit PaaD n=1 Tax=Corynebacterium glyciniphilum TaxID=1404244 RepID=UPI003FD2086E
MVTADSTAPDTQTQVWAAAATVTDPEIPVLTIADLGILRKVAVDGDSVTVTITPTYSGCPAMSQITADVTDAVARTGFDHSRIRVETVLSPAWTTDWMTEEGKRKLTEYGIAPPTHRSTPTGPVSLQLGLPRPDVPCPRCQSHNTRELTRFASTSCKALCVCNDCHEPFDYFKVH